MIAKVFVPGDSSALAVGAGATARAIADEARARGAEIEIVRTGSRGLFWLEPMIEAAHTVKRHWDGILRWFDSKIANGLIEGINSLVQAAKAKARGYRSTRNLKAMVYLLAGKLDLRLPA